MTDTTAPLHAMQPDYPVQYEAPSEEQHMEILNTIKEHGLNHVRFHSWCPPEAAFIAADKAGIYLQPEAASWPNNKSSIESTDDLRPGTDE